MRKKAAAKMPRQQRVQVTSCTITPAAWNKLRSFVFQLQNGQPLAFEHTFRTPRMATHVFSRGHFSHAQQTPTVVC
jgi:hypothetical protein